MSKRITLLFAAGFLLSLTVLVGGGRAAPADATVAPNGDGQFKSVQDAINAAPAGSRDRPWVIHIKPGVYKELVYVQREKRFLRLEGENPAKCVLTYGLYAGMAGPDGKPIGTFRTASTLIDADDFTAENITFENSAGPVGQALAIRLDGDRNAFRNCRFLGWQDTILTNRGRHYFEGCYIAGHVDFINPIFPGCQAFESTTRSSIPEVANELSQLAQDTETQEAHLRSQWSAVFRRAHCDRTVARSTAVADGEPRARSSCRSFDNN